MKFKSHYNVEVPENFAFMHKGQIPALFSENLKSQSFSQTSWAPKVSIPTFYFANMETSTFYAPLQGQK